MTWFEQTRGKDMNRLKEKVVLVTGAAGAIGSAIAEAHTKLAAARCHRRHFSSDVRFRLLISVANRGNAFF
jgi:NAD(P)-dependent dehydrogenase (short-subunit alcohol dehydrogenase family)